MKKLILHFALIAGFSLSAFSQAGHYGTVTANNSRPSAPTLTLTAPNSCSDIGNLKSGKIEVRNFSASTADNFINSQACFTIGNTNTNRNVWVQVTIPAGSGIFGLYFYSSTSGVTPQPTSSTNLRTANIAVYNGAACTPTSTCGSTWDNAITDIRVTAPHIRGIGTERVDVVPGNTYRIEIFTTVFSTDPNYNFDVFVVPLGVVPANSNCANAIPFTNQIACNLGAKAACNTDIPDCAFTLENSVFYSFVKPGVGPFELTISNVQCEGGGNDLQSAIYLASTANCNTNLNNPIYQLDDQCFTGSYNYTINNSDPPGTEYIIWFDGNAGAACNWGIEVNNICTTPTISTQPVNRTICSSGSSSLSVSASSGPYQWQYNNGGTWTNVSNGLPVGFSFTGNTSSTLNITTTNANQGSYQFRVVVGDPGCTVISNVITVTVPGATRLAPLGPVCSGTQLNFDAFPTSGATYSWTVSPPGGISATPLTGSGQTFSTTPTNSGVSNTLPISVNVTFNGVTCTINFNPTINPIPEVPTISSTAASCSSAEISTISNFSGSNTYTFSPVGPTVGAGGVVNGMIASTNYTVTATLGTCSSAASAVFNNDPIFPTPAVPTISSTAASCSSAEISTITNFSGSNTYTFSPVGPTIGAGGLVNGMIASTDYTVTATLGTCTSVASAVFNNDPILTSLVVPTINSTAATCSSAEISTISNFSGSNTYTFSPVGPTVGAGGVVNGMTAITDYTVTASSGSCISAASAVFNNNPILPTPAAPTISSTAATCSSSEISTITNFSGSNIYTFLPIGPTIGAGGVVNGMIAGTNYTVTATLGTCTSTASAVFNNDPILPTPAVPSINSTPASCSSAEISTISNFSGSNTYTFLPVGPTVGAGGVISGMTASTNYTVTSTLGTCSSTSSAVFNNDPILPTPIVSGTGPVCVGSTITLSPTSGGTWISNSPTIASVTNAGVVTGLLAGTSTFTFTNTTTTCSNTTASITVNALPIITVPSPATVCIGAATNLTPTTSGTWISSNPAVATINNGGVVTGVTGGTANMTFTNATTGCSNTLGSASITVNTLPTLPTTPTMTQSACALSTGSLTGAVAAGNGTLSYTWTNSSNVVVGTTADLLNAPAGSYSLTVLDGNGCESQFGPFNITNPNAPNAPTVSGNPASVCEGGSFTLNASSGAASPIFNWVLANGSSVTGSSITVNPVNLTDAGNYNVTVTSNNCISPATSVNILVNAAPVMTSANTAEICSGETLNIPLIASVSSSFTWVGVDNLNVNGESTSTQNSSLINNTLVNSSTTNQIVTYTVTPVSSIGSCLGTSQTVNVTVNSLPQITGTPISAPSGCNLSDGSLTGVNIIGNPVLTYDWTNSSGNSVGSSSDLVNQPAGNYTITVTDGNGCENQFGPYSIINPNAPTTPTPIVVNQTCTEATGSITISGGFASYELTGINPVQPLVSNTTGVFTNLVPGVYSVFVIDASSCSSAAITVTILNDDLLDCDGDGVTTEDEVADGTDPNDPCDYLDGSITLTLSGDYLDADCDGDGVTNGDEIADGTDPEDPCDFLSGSITLTPSGDFLDVDCDGDGVTNGDELADGTDPFDPCDYEEGSITLPQGGNWNNADCDGDGVTNEDEIADGTDPGNPCSFEDGSITLTPGGLWNTADCDGDGVTNGDEITDGTDPYDPCSLDELSITLPVTDTTDCDVTIDIPDGFSPNGDLVNDVFVIDNIDNYPNNIFTVLNRWGNIVYEKEGYMNTWDGTSQATVKIGGEDLPTGTYFYILDLGPEVTNQEERFRKGYLFLNR